MRHSSLLFAAAAGAGILALRERRRRRAAERLAAATLESLLNAIDANDGQTGAHVRRVATYALILARAAGLDERTQRSVERVALFHDIGKIHAALFDIVHEESALTPAERRLIDTHPRRGADVLRPLAAFYPDLPAGVLSHHERWDGTGYPRRLRGGRIPLTARIVAIADSFDAITHQRRYRAGRSLPVATDVLAAGRGSQFDPVLVDLFLLPPVLNEIRRAMRRGRQPGQPRRAAKGPAQHETPDITFRWRSERLTGRPQ